MPDITEAAKRVAGKLKDVTLATRNDGPIRAIEIPADIGDKLKQIKDLLSPGDPTGPETPTDIGGTAQPYERAVAIKSPAYGVTFIATSIYDKWASLTHDLRAYVGFPTDDSFRQNDDVIAYFERGMIVTRGNGRSYVVYGMIYGRYRELGDVYSTLGLPTSDEQDGGNGGRVSHFDGADLYWRADTGAKVIYGAIRERWLALGGTGSFLGYPISDEQSVMNGAQEIGRCNRFQGGVIYWSAGTGAWEVHGDIRNQYEGEWNGPAGPLGFPTSNETSTPSSGGRYNAFERGVIVWHPDGPYGGTYAFTGLEFRLVRFDSKGDDGTGGAQDVYVYIDVAASTGERYNRRMPDDGDMGSGWNGELTLLTLGTVHPDLVVTAHFDGWDSDAGRPFDNDDHLGTVDGRYTIDNLWGIFEDVTHWNGDFMAGFHITNPMPFNPAAFRQQLFWPFRNFDTAELSWEEYAATFSDVSNDESTFWHPFDHGFYEAAYKGMAANGNCFGMCLESVYAHTGRSAWSEPISRFGPANAEPNPSSDGALIREVNIKHGYQVGGDVVDWFLGEFTLGHTHDPVRTFNVSRDLYYAGDFPVIALSKGSLQVGGHVVRPYAWDSSDPNRWVIKVANPNQPPPAADDDARNIIEVFPPSNSFRFHFDDGDDWTGDGNHGGRMYAMPYSQLCHEPRTPFWEVLALLVAGTLVILGGSAETTQITDEQGRTFYRTDTTSRANWDDLAVEASRIPEMVRVPFLGGGDDKKRLGIDAVLPAKQLKVTGGFESLSPIRAIIDQNLVRLRPSLLSRAPEAYWSHNRTMLRHEVASTGAYMWATRAGSFAAIAHVSGDDHGREVLSVEPQATGRSLHLEVPADGPARTVDLTFTGPTPRAQALKAFALTGVSVAAGQQIQARLDAGGEQLLVQNPGATIEATVTVQAGSSSGLVKQQVPLEGGKTTVLRPATWSPADLASAPLRIELREGFDGSAISSQDM